MSHRIYHTEGFILGSRNIGEANKLFFILTPDLGLLRVMAQGVRKMHSKLRGHLANYSHLSLSVVRGREFWRLIAAENKNVFEPVYAEKEAVRLVGKIFAVLSRLIAGEGGHKSAEIFCDIKRALTFLEEEGMSEENLLNVEHVLMLRLMRHLGYIKEDPKLNDFLDFGEWRKETIEKMSNQRTLAAQAINASLEHSHI